MRERKKMFWIGLMVIILFLYLGKSGGLCGKFKSKGGKYKSEEMTKEIAIYKNPGDLYKSEEETNSQIAPNFFQNLGSPSIFAIFDFFKVDDFQSAVQMFNITKKQQKGFPKFSMRQYGTLTTEYYLDENGSEFLPSWVKQMAIFKAKPPKHPLYLVLQQNREFKFDFSGNLFTNNSLHGFESLFIGPPTKNEKDFVVFAFEQHNGSPTRGLFIDFDPKIDGSLKKNWHDDPMKRVEFDMPLFLFSPSIHAVNFPGKSQLRVFVHRFTATGQTLRIILCFYNQFDPTDLIINMNATSGKVENITFMGNFITINEFFEKSYKCQCKGAQKCSREERKYT